MRNNFSAADMPAELVAGEKEIADDWARRFFAGRGATALTLTEADVAMIQKEAALYAIYRAAKAHRRITSRDLAASLGGCT